MKAALSLQSRQFEFQCELKMVVYTQNELGTHFIMRQIWRSSTLWPRMEMVLFAVRVLRNHSVLNAVHTEQPI